MTRLSNKTKKDKAAHILGAARTVLASQGYAGATITRVAQEAGVSRGLLHYYFANKEEMLAKVLRSNMEFSVEMINELFEECASTKQLSSEIVFMMRDLIRHNPDYFHLFFESISTSRRSPVVSRELTSLYNQARQALYKGLCDWRERGLINPAMPIAGLAGLITGILDGMGVQLIAVEGISEQEEIWQALEKGLLLILGT